MKSTKKQHPYRTACMAVLREYGTPPHVVGHCKAVAAVGCTLAKALNAAGHALALDLILAAGLLHDMARVEEQHELVAADFCDTRGWGEEAAVIRVHMTYDRYNDLAHLNETDIICLSDRMVIEDRYAGLDRRMDYIVAKAHRNGHGEYEPFIRRKMGEARKLIDQIEAEIGCSIDELMKDLDYEAPEGEPAV